MTLKDWGVEGCDSAPVYIEDGNAWADLPEMRVHLTTGTSAANDAMRAKIRAAYPLTLTQGRFHAVSSGLPNGYSLAQFAAASGGVVTGNDEISYGDQVVQFCEAECDGNLWPVAGSLPA